MATINSLDVPDKPHQPEGFSFPYRQFGKKNVVKRNFQSNWFTKWPWLHYNEDQDTAFCHTCMKAKAEKKLQASSADLAFITKGFHNWKDACVKFNVHQSSNCHKEAVLKVFTLPATIPNVAECLSKAHQVETLERRQCFLKILSNLRFLARQGIAIRGHGDESDSNFHQLLKLRKEDDPRIETWLKKKTDKYTSSDIQNEILKIMALHISRNIMVTLHSVPFLVIMVDETTDASNKEQVVFCIRWVDSMILEAHEEFIGLYQVGSTDASSLFAVIHDVLLRLNISITKIRGQCYDGASSMAGTRSGVATRIMEEEPKALYTHCYGHALSLACSDSVMKCKLMRNALDTVYEITKLIKKSPRRDAVFQTIKQQLCTDSPGIRILCPTRWTVRADALLSVISNYAALQALWNESLDFVKEADMRSRIVGVSASMNSFDFFFGAVLGEMLLRHSDNLSKTLQSKRMSAAEGQQLASMTIKTLQLLRTDESFSLFWTKVLKLTNDLEVDEPALPRRRKAPKRYEIGSSEGDFPLEVEAYYRQIYFEALDLIVCGIQNRFDQPGYRVYCKLEDLLVKAANKEDHKEEFEFITKFYNEDFDAQVLQTHLDIMSCNLPDNPKKHDLHSVLSYLRDMPDFQRALMSQVSKLASLILVMPATNSTSERSFSALRRVKNYLRSTMTQVRLNSIMTLNVHKERTDCLNLVDIGNDFVVGSEHRQSIFGTFRDTDVV